MPFSIQLNKPVTPNSIPTADDVLRAAKAVIDDEAVKWKSGSSYINGTVQTFTGKVPHAEGSATWYARTSNHGPEDGNFDQFWEGLGVNHSDNEAKYIPAIEKATLLKRIEPGIEEVWSLHYNLGPLLSRRTFTILIVTILDTTTPRRQGWVISAPFDASSDSSLAELEQSGVRGKYASVEKLTEKEDGTVEWRMATTSSPGGLIPDIVTGPAMPKQIAQDVLHFVGWMKSLRSSQASVEAPPASGD